MGRNIAGPRAHLSIDSVNGDQLAVILTACAKARDLFPSYNTHEGGEPEWAPITHICGRTDAGPLFTVYVRTCPLEVVAQVLGALEMDTANA